jgi:hypothetical protein
MEQLLLKAASCRVECGINSRQVAANEPDPPTYSKVKDALEEVKEKAVRGDFVYLHYSGHGGLQQRRDNPEHPLFGSRGGKTYEVLILHGDTHFKDYKLGGFLDDFASAGITVSPSSIAVIRVGVIG